jgi:hypothetical protein
MIIHNFRGLTTVSEIIHIFRGLTTVTLSDDTSSGDLQP